ncbi:MAG TPA: hypothetical protein VN154_06430 [Rhizomicrobium sp.]|nr:hypothetical protein [Rhizomicrobium sp.]
MHRWNLRLIRRIVAQLPFDRTVLSVTPEIFDLVVLDTIYVGLKRGIVLRQAAVASRRRQTLGFLAPHIEVYLL